MGEKKLKYDNRIYLNYRITDDVMSHILFGSLADRRIFRYLSDTQILKTVAVCKLHVLLN